MDLLSEKLFQNKLKLLLILVLPSLVLFFRTLQYDFSPMDEQWMILKNVPFLEKWSSIKDAFSKPLNDTYYRPLFVISLIIDYHLGHLSPFIYHFTNLLLHLISVYLLFRFLVFSLVDKKLAVIYSLLFSVHPMILHAVAWIPGRNDLLLCIFTLAALIYLHKYILSPGIKPLLLHLLFFACALLTKENSIVLPFIFIPTYLIYKKFGNKSFYLLVFIWIAMAAAFFILRQQIVTNSSVTDRKLFGNPLDFLAALLLFIGKAVIPVYQSILPIVTKSSIILGIFSILLITILCYRPGLKDKKIGLLGLFIFFMLIIIPAWFGAFKSSGEHYEHRLYASLAGLLLFFSQIKFNTDSKLFMNCVLVLFCLFFIKSYSRMKVYKNKEFFIESGLKDRPDFYLFYVQKGEILYKNHDFSGANELFSKAIELRPDKADIYSQRGSARFSMGSYQEAIDDFTNAIKKSDFRMEYYLNRCIAYNKVSDIKNAMNDLNVLKKCCQNKIPSSLEKSITEKWEIVSKNK